MTEHAPFDIDDTAAVPPPQRPVGPLPPRREGRGRWWKVLLAIVLVGALLLAAFGFYVYRKIDPPGSPGAQLAVEIPQGSSTKRIAAILAAKDVITDARIFEIYVKVDGSGPWQAGNYTFRKHMSIDEAVAVLDHGPEISYTRLTIPEGYTLQQIADRVGRVPGRSAEKFLALARSGTIRSAYQPQGSTNLEGLLFPDTYTLDGKDNEERILRRMVQAMDQKIVELGIPETAARLKLTPYQVIIVASMIEREARVPEERGKVARVVYNRLDKGIRLGIDATTRYELNKPSAPLRQSELERDSPYNTRTRAGLPPTPISNPGQASLEAAAHPTPGDWIYYVIADADGHHVFVTTSAEFERAKAAAKAKGLL